MKRYENKKKLLVLFSVLSELSITCGENRAGKN